MSGKQVAYSRSRTQGERLGKPCSCNCYECLAIGFYLHQEKKTQHTEIGILTDKKLRWPDKTGRCVEERERGEGKSSRMQGIVGLSAPISDGRTVSLLMERCSCFTDWLTNWLTDWLHVAEATLRSQEILSWSTNSSHFMETEGPLPHSQHPAGNFSTEIYWALLRL
jgi:hypothetical protein